MTKIRFLIGLFLCCTCIQIQAQQAPQTLSFITEKLNDGEGGIFVDMTETEDGGFLLLTTYNLFKIDRKGRMEWKRGSHETDIKADGIPIVSVALFTHVFEDKEGIYVYGVGPSSAPYYARLNHQGEMLFDTLYWDSFFDTLEPYTYANTILLEGDELFVAGSNYHNLHRDTAGEWQWDRTYYSFYKFDKRTGERLWSYYDYFTDSSVIARRLVRLEGEDKGFLLYLVQHGKWAMTDVQTNHLLLRLDSLGRIVRLNDMYPKEHFADKGYVMSGTERRNANNPLVGIPKGELPRVAIGIKEAERVWTKAVFVKKSSGIGSHDFYITYDREGRFVETISVPFDYGVSTRTYYGQGWERTEIFYIDRNGDTLWKHPANIFPSLPYMTRSPLATLPGNFYYFHTSKGGLLQVGEGSEGVGTDSMYLFKVIRHINHLGWAFGYDPDAWTKDKPVHAWFNAQEQLVIPQPMHGWQVSVSDLTGRLLCTAPTPENGIVTLPQPLSTGVYIVYLHNPESGEVKYKKIFKGE